MIDVFYTKMASSELKIEIEYVSTSIYDENGYLYPNIREIDGRETDDTNNVSINIKDNKLSLINITKCKIIEDVYELGKNHKYYIIIPFDITNILHGSRIDVCIKLAGQSANIVNIIVLKEGEDIKYVLKK